MIKRLMTIAYVALNFSIPAAFAMSKDIACPTLSANDVQKIIQEATLMTNQSYTLTEETGKTRAQILTDEPTANPFDTFYSFYQEKKVGEQNFFFLIGNVLGNSSFEAKDRVKQILLSEGDNFQSEFDSDSGTCFYRHIQADASNPKYPFKTKYENIVLVGSLSAQMDISKFLNQK